MAIDLFKDLRKRKPLHPQFLKVRDEIWMAPARGMLNEVAATMEEPDGNFAEQFQTHGFDSRTFEIYLQAFFTEAGHVIDRRHDRPDFLISRDGLTVAVEAVTANPPPNKDYTPYVPIYLDPPKSSEEALHYFRNEVAIKFGSPLYSKLKKEYWKLPHVAGKPLIIAIESFHGEASLTISSTNLSNFLFGLYHHHHFDDDGNIVVEADKVKEHIGSKTIRSNFFQLEGAENISAILFSNTGTIGKFNRMGQEGQHRSSEVRLFRYGTCYDDDPNSAMAATFAYEVGEGNFPPEPWRQGSVLIHNPGALHPIPAEWLGAGAEENLEASGTVVPILKDPFLPYMSMTKIFPASIPTRAIWDQISQDVKLLAMGMTAAQGWI